MDFDFGNTEENGCAWYDEYLGYRTMVSKTAEAIQMLAHNWSAVVAFAGSAIQGIQFEDGKLGAMVTVPVTRKTVVGRAIARETDWILKYADGTFAVVKDEEFKQLEVVA